MKILIADDSKTTRAMLTAAIEDFGHQVIIAATGNEAIELYQKHHPDLLILDVVMGKMDGFECARRIREIENNQDWVPIIFLSSSIDDESIAKGIDAGGDDYLTKPFSHITLAAKIKAMQRISDMRKRLFDLTKELDLLSITDPLTRLYNRLQFDRTLKEKLRWAEQRGIKIALLFIDLDKFKEINDTYGHNIGDLLLKEVANRLRATVRQRDFIARLGGDEFAIIAEVESENDATKIAEKIVRTLADDYVLESKRVNVSASVGIAFYPVEGTTIDNFVKNADTAMYHVKNTSKNSYSIYTPEDILG